MHNEECRMQKRLRLLAAEAMRENMTRSRDLGNLAGLRLTAAPSAIAGSLILWALLSVIGVALDLSPVAAVVGGLIAVLLHWLGETVHQLGHAWAARRTGHPMIGVRFWWVLSASIY